MIYWVNRVTGEITGHKREGEEWEKVDTDLESAAEHQSLARKAGEKSYKAAYWALAIIAASLALYNFLYK